MTVENSMKLGALADVKEDEEGWRSRHQEMAARNQWGRQMDDQ